MTSGERMVWAAAFVRALPAEDRPLCSADHRRFLAAARMAVLTMRAATYSAPDDPYIADMLGTGADRASVPIAEVPQ